MVGSEMLAALVKLHLIKCQCSRERRCSCCDARRCRTMERSRPRSILDIKNPNQPGRHPIGSMRGPCDENVLRTQVAEFQVERKAQPWILAATILGSSLAFIDGTVV